MPRKKGIMENLYKLLDSPVGWKLGSYTLDHEIGISLWISNGWPFCDFYPNELQCLTIAEKIIVWLKIKKLRRLIIDNKIKIGVAQHTTTALQN